MAADYAALQPDRSGTRESAAEQTRLAAPSRCYLWSVLIQYVRDDLHKRILVTASGAIDT